LFLSYSPLTFAQERLALVIGNAGYDGESLTQLKNPLNDAALIKSSLGKAGFEVTLATDQDLRGMKKAVKSFTKKLKEAESDTVALFYYSGHGFQANNLNYLAPLDAELEDEVDAEF
jgi:uncharacterized caspase-like protein